MVHCKVETEGQKSVVEVLCKEGDDWRQDRDALFISFLTSADGEKSVHLEHFEEQEVFLAVQKLNPRVQAQLLAHLLLLAPLQVDDRQI